MNLSPENVTLQTKYEVILLEGKGWRIPDKLLNDISLDYITLIPYD